jgi:high-affinity iron transporter
MNKVKVSLTVLAALAIAPAGLVIAGCGEDSGSEPAHEAEADVTPDEAITEIGAVRSGLDQGLAAYRKGDADAADQAVGDAYLEHFELVEGPLEEADPELNEELEVLIRETLTNAIAEGEPVKDVEKLVDDANAGLDEAEKALGGSEGGGASAGGGAY